MAETLDYQSAFDRATQNLSQGQWQQARDILLALREKNVTSADLESNLGRAYSELGDHGLAAYHLTNAVALDRVDFDARNDLKAAQAKVGEGMGTPMAHPAEWGNAISSYLRPIECYEVGSALLLGFIFAKLFSRPSRRLSAFLLSGSAIFSILGCLAIYGHSLAVLTKEADLRSTPLESAQVMMTLKPGTRLRIIRHSGDFAEVERSGSFRGWIPGSNLTLSPY